MQSPHADITLVTVKVAAVVEKAADVIEEENKVNYYLFDL